MTKPFLHSVLSVLLLSSVSSQTQGQAVRELKTGLQWRLDAGPVTYIVGVDDNGVVQTQYWGSKLSASAAMPRPKAAKSFAAVEPPINDTAAEFLAWGGGAYAEPDLKTTFANGDRTATLRFRSGLIADGRLELTLRDTVQPLEVRLIYQPYPQGVIGRWAVVQNDGQAEVCLEQLSAASWNLPLGSQYTFDWITGEWAGEWQMHSEAFQVGKRVLESRRGSTSHRDNPWFAVGRSGETTEESGEVWFGELAWSGNWKITAERSARNSVRVTGGLNDFDFAHILHPGETLTSPVFYGGYTARGKGEASRILHQFQRAEILPRHPDPLLRPVLYNSWEATHFNVDEPGQIALAEKASQLGVERFVVDDGWFGQRSGPRAGLGDWNVNPTTFPSGLKPLINRVRSLGMDFGLWVEPEMVNPDSDLYRAHPDWVLSFPGRPRTEERHQLVLNLAMPEVREYIFHSLNKLLNENEIAFLKWDYNRNWSEAGWATAPGVKLDSVNIAAQKEVYLRYVQNLYDILERLRRAHPELQIESCSSGGGRVDLGILRYAEQVWPSDNTDAYDRLLQQYGFTHAYTPQVMMSWVTDTPNHLIPRTLPLQFRFAVSMQGGLGLAGNLSNWSSQEMSAAKAMVAFYKTFRQTVQQGDLYRLQSPINNESSQVEYVSPNKSQAVLLAYLRSEHFANPAERIRLRGLDPDADYKLTPLQARPEGKLEIISGSVLMGLGLDLNVHGDYASAVIRLDRVTGKE